MMRLPCFHFTVRLIMVSVAAVSVPGGTIPSVSSTACLLPLVAWLPIASLPDEEVLPLTYMTGFVCDADRRPIAGATVRLIGTRGYHEIRRNSPVPAVGTSDANGRYRLGFYTRPGGTVEVLGVSAYARGYVRSDVEFGAAKPVMKPGETTEINVELTRGEVLAGVVECPWRLAARLSGEDEKKRTYIFRVRGPSYRQSHLYETEPGGAFEIWVPKGEYDLILTLDGETEAAVLKGVASGTRGHRLVKTDEPVAEDILARAFDALWDDMGRNYSYFVLKKIDWPALKAKYRARAVAAGTLPGFVDVLGEMLGELDDGHVWFEEPKDAVIARRNREWRFNGNDEATEAAIERVVVVGNGFAHVGTSKEDGFGVVRIIRQSRAEDADVREVVEFIRSHAAAPGFLVDLRVADGGSELVARRIASEFCPADVVYAKSRYRGGPEPTDFGPTFERTLEASARPYKKPVVCVLGPGCVSSGEGLAQMMRCLKHVTTVGMPTRGSSGNPRPFKLPGIGVEVVYSRWVDLMPDGTPLEGRGVRPEVVVDLPEAAYATADPTWAKAVGLLREKTKTEP